MYLIDEPGPFASTKQLEDFLASLESLPSDPEVEEARDRARAQLKLRQQGGANSSSSLTNPQAPPV
jgi:hypothetical protein